MSKIAILWRAALLIVRRGHGAIDRSWGRTGWRGLLLSLLLVSAGVQALDNYWVVGSFAREANASREAERLSRVTGIDISYKRFRNSGMIYYGVVTPASLSPAALQTLRDELAKTGVTDLWLTSLAPDVSSSLAAGADSGTRTISAEAGNSSPPAEARNPDGLYYLVVESTTDVDAAVALELKLNKTFGRVSSMTALAEGNVQHRVVIGPGTLVALDLVASRLQQTGYTDTWLMPYEANAVAPATAEPLLLDSGSQRIAATERGPTDRGPTDRGPTDRGPTDSPPTDNPRGNTDSTAPIDACGRPYNLARLARDC
ncbi:hypothetical protein OAC87_07525 [Pseudomonadales bacterium]|nr:hypothetical protein [Pseudomonadales bacterium]